MTMILTEVLDTPIEDILKLSIPSICRGNAIERLRRIIYAARHYLAERSGAEIKQAAADILSLYRWFFDMQAENIRSEIKQQFKTTHDLLLQKYVKSDQYVGDSISAIKSAYLSEVEVLIAILRSHQANLNQIKCVKTNFSDVEFFCVSALYHSSIAITKIRETQAIAEKEKIQFDKFIPNTIEDAYDAVLEAQFAIDYARQLSPLNSPEFSMIIQDHIKDFRQSLTKKAYKARYGEKYQQRRAKAIELYRSGEYRSRLNAALHLIDPIQAYSKQLEMPCLKSDSAQETIYKWLSDYDKGRNTTKK